VFRSVSNLKVRNYIYFQGGIRGFAPLFEKINLGLEINYVSKLGTYGNSDYLKTMIFMRTKIYKNIFGEFGIQGNKMVSSARSNEVSFLNFCTSIGYQTRLYKNFNLEFQLRKNHPSILSKKEGNLVLAVGINHYF